MLPMHYAYQNNKRFDKDPRKAFDVFFHNLSNEFDPNDISSFTTKSQFLYFTTQFLKLKSEQGRLEEFQKLYNLITSELVNIWMTAPAFHWDKSLNFTGVRERLIWNLSEPDTSYSHYRAVLDEDWFIMASLSDISVIYKNQQNNLNFDIDELNQIVEKIFSRFSSYHDNYLYIQKGVWWDHRDYRYVGHDSISEDMEPKTISDIAIDSSHSHRMPLWLLSFADSDTENSDFYKGLLAEMKNTFENKVFEQKNDNGYKYLLMNNFMDGNNGVYRYNYETQGDGSGYEGFQLSGTLFIGYYSFLNSDLYRDSLRSMSNSFPLKQKVLDFYVGPNTSRFRHPKFEWPAYFENGFAELYARIASCHNSSLKNCDPT